MVGSIYLGNWDMATNTECSCGMMLEIWGVRAVKKFRRCNVHVYGQLGLVRGAGLRG